VARRVIDFLSGCAFALSGSIMKASSNVIIIAPKDVGLDDAKTDDEQLDA
jgi:FtsZ-interacting cell division protein YlmF